MKAVGQSEMPKPILRVGSSFHIGDLTAQSLGIALHIPLKEPSVCGQSPQGGWGSLKGRRGLPPRTPQTVEKQPFNFLNSGQNTHFR